MSKKNNMKGLWDSMNIMPESGDFIGGCCVNCGRTYPYHVGVDEDRSMKRCPECYKDFNKIWKTSVAGSMRVNDKAVRDILVKAIEESTPYKVFVEERVGDIWIYDSQTSGGSADK